MTDDASPIAVTPAPSAQPWEQYPGEPDDRYVMFLVFLNLGPTRTILNAYQVYNSQTPGTLTQKRKLKLMKANEVVHSGSWDRFAREWDWRRRAARWDVYSLNSLVPETASIIFQVLKTYALKVLTAVEKMEIDPTHTDALRADITTLTTLISPEAIARAAANNSRDAGHGRPATSSDSEEQ